MQKGKEHVECIIRNSYGHTIQFYSRTILCQVLFFQLLVILSISRMRKGHTHAMHLQQCVVEHKIIVLQKLKLFHRMFRLRECVTQYRTCIVILFLPDIQIYISPLSQMRLRVIVRECKTLKQHRMNTGILKCRPSLPQNRHHRILLHHRIHTLLLHLHTQCSGNGNLLAF